MTFIDKLHYLAVGDDGKYSHQGKYQSSSDQVNAIVENLKAKEIKELTIYFHGGLNKEISIEANLQSVLAKLDERNKPNSEAMVFIWKTGFLETVRENLDEIFQSSFGRSLLKWSIRAITKKLKVDFTKSVMNDGLSLDEIEQEWNEAESQNRIPFETIQVEVAGGSKGTAFISDNDEDSNLVSQIQTELEGDYYFNPSKTENDWGTFPHKTSVSSDLKNISSEESSDAKGFDFASLALAIAKVAIRVIKRYTNDSNHTFQATVVEEICRAYFISDAGQWVWGGMKSKAEQMWAQGDRVGFDLLDRLSKELPNIQLNLIGHSAGSIAICHLIRKKREQRWPISIGKILWLAPACRMDLFLEEIIKYNQEFQSFLMITMKDSFEMKDALVNKIPWLYPSSLLYFISGVLEQEADTPLAGMARYHRSIKPYTTDMFKEIEIFLNADFKRIILSETDDGASLGFQSKAIDHGAFDNDESTLKTMITFLS